MGDITVSTVVAHTHICVWLLCVAAAAVVLPFHPVPLLPPAPLLLLLPQMLPLPARPPQLLLPLLNALVALFTAT